MFGLEAIIDLRIKILEVYGDSTLVISQVNEYWEVKDHKLIPTRTMSTISFLTLMRYHSIISFMERINWQMP